MRMIPLVGAILAATLLTSNAQTSRKVHYLGIVDDNRSLALSTFPTPDNTAIRLMVFFSDVENVRSVTIKTGASTLIACTTAICDWLWQKTDMVARKCLQCPVTVIVTDKVGKTYRADTMVLRP